MFWEILWKMIILILKQKSNLVIIHCKNNWKNEEILEIKWNGKNEKNELELKFYVLKMNDFLKFHFQIKNWNWFEHCYFCKNYLKCFFLNRLIVIWKKKWKKMIVIFHKLYFHCEKFENFVIFIQNRIFIFEISV